MSHIKFQGHIVSGYLVSQLPESVTDRHTIGKAQTNMPFNFFVLRGIMIRILMEHPLETHVKKNEKNKTKKNNKTIAVYLKPYINGNLILQ